MTREGSDSMTGGRQPAGYARRLAGVEPRLAADFKALYGQEPAAASAWSDLLSAIERASGLRPDWLRALDDRREADPIWFLSAGQLGYSCYVDRFGGTLSGIGDQIPHLKRLGVTYLHLLPFWKRPEGENDGGFAVTDHAVVQPELGSIADLETLARTLSDAGISLGADLVLNHTANDHEWARAARAGDQAHRNFYHVFPTRRIPDAYERTLAQIFPDAAPGNFTEIEGLGWVWTTFYPFQWDLNWHNPAVFVEIVRTLLYLANRGIGVFRLDSAPFLWKRLGTNCQNQPETHVILRLFRAVIDIAAPSVLLKAEAVVPARELPAYFGLPDQPGSECHLAYHTGLMAASWAAIAHRDTALLREVVAGTPRLGEAGSWLIYIRCHDDIRWDVLEPDCSALGDPSGLQIREAARYLTDRGEGSFARGQAFESNGLVATNGMTASLVGIEAGIDADDAGLIDAGIARVILLHALALSIGGLPVLYMGDELGQLNASERVAHVDGRSLHRPIFDRAAAARIDDPASIPGRIFPALETLVHVRRAQPALDAATPVTVLATAIPALFAFRRGPDFAGFFNFSPDAVAIGGLLGGAAEWRDLLTGASVDANDNLAGWSFRWISRAR